MVILLYFVGLAVFVKFRGMDMLRDEKSGLIFVVVATVGLFIAVEINEIPKKLRARKMLAHLTGRAEGRITSHYQNTYETRDEDDNIHTNSRGTVISYEFDVNGNTYKGQGYGSWAFGKTKHQTICYDPEHPEDNLPLYDVDRQTKTHFISSLLYLAVSFAILAGIFWIAYKVARG